MALKSARSLIALHPKSVNLCRRHVHMDSTSSSSILQVAKSLAEEQESILLLGRPLRKNSFVKAFENHRSKVALVEHNEEFLYEDILRRSIELARVLKDLFKYEDRSTDHKICFICSNGLSFLLATLACWFSGNTAVPLSAYHGEVVLNHALSQNSSPFVIVSSEFHERIRPIAKDHNRQVVVLDSSWTRDAAKKFNTESPLPSLFEESFYHGDRNGMIFYTAGTSTGIPKPVTLNHYVIDSRLQKTVDAWELSGDDVTLHAIPILNHYGILDALLAPMSAGSKVISVNSADPTKIWSHLLGIGLNSSPILSKANFFPSVPNVYLRLQESHQELFQSRKIRDYVKSSCAKKIRSMVCGGGSLPSAVKTKWKGITGHTIVETYTKTEFGTVFCGNVSKPELATKDQNKSSLNYCKPLPGTEFRVVRFLDSSRTRYEVLLDNPDSEELDIEEMQTGGLIGELLLRNTEYHIEEADENGWLSTKDIVRVRGGQVQIIGKILDPSLKRFKNIERQFSKYSGIVDSYVFGFDGPESEISLAVVLVIDPNLEKSSLESILMDFKNNNYIYPSICKILSEIPLDSTGRVNKFQVAETVFKGKSIPKLYFEDYTL